MKKYSKTPKVIFPLRKLDGLSVNHYGMQKCVPGNSYGPATREYYLIHYVMRGRGSYFCKGKAFEVEENQIFLIRPNEECTYKADEDDPWEYYFVAFSGADAVDIVNHIDWTDEYVFTPKNKKSIRSIMKSLFMIKRVDAIGRCLVLSSIYKLFAELLGGNAVLTEGEASPTGEELSVGEETLIFNNAKRYIEENLSSNISVDALAKHLGLHRTSLYRLFKKTVGISVTKYILNIRMDKAAYYLLNTRLSLSEISLMVGFSDYAHFFRTFKKTFGFGPTEYRNKF